VTRLTRRHFIGGAAAAPLLLTSRRHRPRGDVIVVGAGLAGLVAAHELERRGWRVRVIEARDRVGGRVHTIHLGEQHAEAGGEFIDTSHRALLGYVRRLGLRLEDAQRGFGNREDVVFLRGQRRRPASTARFWSTARELHPRLDLRDPVAGRPAAILDRHTVADLLDASGIRREGRVLAEAYVRDEYCVEPAQLSLLFFSYVEKLAWPLGASQAERYRIRGGNDAVPRGLAARLHHEPLLGAPVERVARPGRRVEVSAGGRTLVADWCVLAAPLPSLRAIEFDPPLEPAVAAAIAHVQYGSGGKTLLRYRDRPWVRRGETGDVVSDLSFVSAWDATNQQPGSAGILIGYLGGDKGARWVALPDADRIETIRRDVDAVYPGSYDTTIGSATAAWREGTYSAWAPGDMTRWWRAVRRPQGRVVLAGEHTSAYATYMEGAVRSGRRAAALIDRRDD
jgi:monoamine oxidase